jgi:hypothetical protein
MSFTYARHTARGEYLAKMYEPGDAVSRKQRRITTNAFKINIKSYSSHYGS